MPPFVVWVYRTGSLITIVKERKKERKKEKKRKEKKRKKISLPKMLYSNWNNYLLVWVNDIIIERCYSGIIRRYFAFEIGKWSLNIFFRFDRFFSVVIVPSLWIMISNIYGDFWLLSILKQRNSQCDLQLKLVGLSFSWYLCFNKWW